MKKTKIISRQHAIELILDKSIVSVQPIIKYCAIDYAKWWFENITYIDHKGVSRKCTVHKAVLAGKKYAKELS